MRYTRGLKALSVALLAIALSYPLSWAQVSVLNYFAATTGRDNILNIDGTLEFEDKVSVIDHGVQSVTGYATLTTNLTGGITDCVLTAKSAAAGTSPTLDPVHMTMVTTTGSAVLDIHVWKATSSSDGTLIKSTTATTIGYVCFGAD